MQMCQFKEMLKFMPSEPQVPGIIVCANDEKVEKEVTTLLSATKYPFVTILENDDDEVRTQKIVDGFVKKIGVGDFDWLTCHCVQLRLRGDE
mgnify:FL=1